MSRPVDHGDENQVASIKKSKKLQFEEQQENLRRVLSTYEGRAVFWKLLGDCKMFESVAIGDNPLVLAASQALQNFGKRVLADVLTANVNSFNIMRDEAMARETRQKVDNGG